MRCEICKRDTYQLYVGQDHIRRCSGCHYMQEAIKRIRTDEGKQLKLYQCSAKKWTIGIGRNLSDRGINSDEAELMFHNYIAECLDDLPKIFPRFDNFSEGRQGAFLNMRFQMGPGGLRKFKKMIKAANTGNWKEVVLQAKDSKWYKYDTPERAARVVACLGGDERWY